MSYGEKVLSRLSIPGIALLILGAVVVYTSSKVAPHLFPKKPDVANVVIKAVGCLLALLGALILLDFIG